MAKTYLIRIAAVIFVGAVIRLTVAAINPPNNAYDDHLESIALYTFNGERPHVDACWQCYHPPVYPLLASALLHTSFALTGNALLAWEAVQWGSAAASIGTLILTAILLAVYFSQGTLLQATCLALLVVLPRDIYTAASIGNDALLGFFVTGAVVAFALSREHGGRPPWYGGLALFAVAAAWTKQSGIVLILLLALASLAASKATRATRERRWVLLAFAVVSATAMADEARRTHTTGIALVSNQHFDYRAQREGQPPGVISRQTLVSVRAFGLYEHPTLHQATVDSFWTAIFARTWFDYEPRFLPQYTAMVWLARALYVLGLIVVSIVGLGVVDIVRRGPQSARELLVVPIGFIGAAMAQTIRFPHFSSMKAVFVLPAASVLVLCFGFGLRAIPSQAWRHRIAAALLIAFALLGSLHWAAVLLLNDDALNTPTAPLWPIPQVLSIWE